MLLSSVDVDISTRHLPAFMINFIVCYKCNLDCSYCDFHDNDYKPLPLDECKKSIDFIFKYTDIVLSAKLKHERRMSLNLIGGEPFAHPDIVDILEYIRQVYVVKYKDNFKLSVCVTTNGIIGPNALARSIDLVDFWTVSYHTEALDKQKELTLDTINALYQGKKILEVRVMAPSDPAKFAESQRVHSQLVNTGVTALMKPIMGDQYASNQAGYMKIFWKTKEEIQQYNTATGITCCSERPLILNEDKNHRTNFIPDNNFRDWYCALNWNFLSVNHFLEVFLNTHCHVSNQTNKEEPLGTIADADRILKQLQEQIDNKSVPVIQCPKKICHGCGMCAPKAKTKEEMTKIMKKHLVDVSILDFKE